MAKKFKSCKGTFTIDVYDACITLLVGENSYEEWAKTREVEGIEHNPYGQYMFSKGSSESIIYISNDALPHTLTHECVHAGVHILSNVGCPPTNEENDEVLAYLVGCIYSKCLIILEKK